MKKAILIILVFFLMFQTVSAAHYIVGYVENALDGESANGKIVTLWNPVRGQVDNLTDIVGTGGNSGVDNIYFLDCEELSTSCIVGDNLTLKIFNSGDNYVSNEVNVTVTGFGYDSVGNLTLNSPPSVSLVSPGQSSFKKADVEFNCSFGDLDNNLKQITLWTNTTGTWQANETKLISGGESWKTFSKNLEQGSYKYNCFVEDDLGVGKFASSNNSFLVDTILPIVQQIQINQTDSCGVQSLKINCTTYDENTSISSVIIQTISPSGLKTNYSAQFLLGNTYYVDTWIDSFGDWQFNCISNDSAGNEQNLTSQIFKAYSSNPDLQLFFDRIYVDKLPSFENELITITADVENKGCGAANNFIVGLFEGITSYQNKTTSIPGRSSQNVSLNWSAKIGSSEIFIYTDLENLILEQNETNNEANISFVLTSWQEIYGNISADRILGNQVNLNMTLWGEESNFEGNIFVTDTELNIDWLSLQAIGKTKTGSSSSNDFSEIDTKLGMTSFEDSVYKTFTNLGVPFGFENFTVFGKQILSVPTINSTNNSNFFTGILWDSSDSLDNEYDSTEKEDLVFATKINKQQLGKYGTYDYEIKIPVKLREYDPSDSSEIYYYYEIN